MIRYDDDGTAHVATAAAWADWDEWRAEAAAAEAARVYCADCGDDVTDDPHGLPEEPVCSACLAARIERECWAARAPTAGAAEAPRTGSAKDA